ncbi:hypothetical protein [Planococcus salinus]|uniref:Uncharacterized protein n=1 Tax=Planococcus salinus TaxID=1848460 RepID=A0A3M8P538_9BACL|nr:hypothetical protein [Planococcus salinus]RNF38786.1 hypothetical protein EEX84_13240 [Planococcus salinus]
MKAPESLLVVWRQFDDFPMETLTKAWIFAQGGTKKQRDVETMKCHRQRYGITGNCFDLAIWLLDAFKEAGVEAYPIGDDLGTEDAHAAVVAVDEKGRRFLCDLGDQWLQPILIDGHDEAYTVAELAGFFPAATVQVKTTGTAVEVLYHRPNGKTSQQWYSAEPVSMTAFLEAAEFSQRHVYPKALVEVRLPYKDEIAHWEFEHWESFLSTSDGLFPDPPLGTLAEWVERLHEKTGFDRRFLKESLNLYKEMNQ